MDNVRDGSARRNSAAPSASFGSRCWRNRPGRKLPTWLVNNVLLISFIWQCLGVVLYRVAFNQAFTSSGAKFDLGVAVMLSFQLLQLLFLAVLFVKLTKQVLHRTVSSFFLLQSYLCTILLFMGIYTVLARALPDSFKGVFDPTTSVNHEIVTIRFLYFSTSVMSTCGFGDIVANTWYADLLVTVQMLLSVIFSVVIFGRGLSFFQQPPQKKRGVGDENAPLINN